ncbi:MAG: YggT family protein [Gemmatimonadales bacterium]
MTFLIAAGYVTFGVRVLVAGAFLLAAIAAATHWAVRRKSLEPFGAWPRFVRGWSDPILKPLEGRIVRSSANPQDAPFWLLGLVVVAGLALIALVRWLLGFIATMLYASETGGTLIIPILVNYAFGLLMAAILVRVVASWFGISRHNTGMRIVYALTDWLIEPMQRIIPNFGPFDLSPIAAYFLLSFTRTLVLRAFF